MPGKYVLFRAKHFMSLEVRANGTNMWRTTCKRHVGCADVKLPLLLRAMEAAFPAEGAIHFLLRARDRCLQWFEKMPESSQANAKQLATSVSQPSAGA